MRALFSPVIKLVAVCVLLLICSLPMAQAQICTPGEERWEPTTLCCEEGAWTWHTVYRCSFNGNFWYSTYSVCNPGDPCG
jgi:hypothetical protein